MDEKFIEEKVEEIVLECSRGGNHIIVTPMYGSRKCQKCGLTTGDINLKNKSFQEGIQKGQEDKTNIEYQRAERYFKEIQELEKNLKDAEQKGRELEMERIEKIIWKEVIPMFAGFDPRDKTWWGHDTDLGTDEELKQIINEKLKEGK